MIPAGRRSTAAEAPLVSVVAGGVLLAYARVAPDLSWASLAVAAFVLAGPAAAVRTRLVARSAGAEAVRVGGAVAGVPCLVVATLTTVTAATNRVAAVLGVPGETGAKAAAVAIGSTQSGLLVVGILGAATVPPAMLGAGLARTVVGTTPTAVEQSSPDPDDWPLSRGTRIGLAAGGGVFVALIADLFVEGTVGGGPITLAVSPVFEALFGNAEPAAVSTRTVGVAVGLLPAVTVGVTTGLWYRARTTEPTLGARLRILVLLNVVPVGLAMAVLVLWLLAWIVEAGIVGVVLGIPALLLAVVLTLAAVPVGAGVPASLGDGAGGTTGRRLPQGARRAHVTDAGTHRRPAGPTPFLGRRQ